MSAPVGKSGAAHDLHQRVERRLRPVDEHHRRVADLAEVVGRDVRGHAHRDALVAVDEQVGEPARQHDRLFVARVVAGLEVDGALVDAREHLGGQQAQPALGVALRGGRVGRRAEVAVLVDEHVREREVLAEAHQRVVDRGVAVRVEPTHDVADDARALHERAVGPQARVVHRPEDAAVHRLQAVAHVGERAAHDHAHRVVEERRLDLFGEGAARDRRLEQRRRGRCLLACHGMTSDVRCQMSAVRCRGSERLWRSAG